MSCKSAIYTANTGSQSLTAGSAIGLGSIIRRFGCDVDLNGNGITIGGAGYYDVDVAITAAPTAAGTVTVTLLRDGVAVPGATASASVTTAGNPVNLSFSALVRQMCNCAGSSLTLLLTGGAATVTNAAVVVMRI